MEAKMIPEEILEILLRLEERGFEAYLAGGCVRDIVMGIAPHDWDIATSALPEEVIAAFFERNVLETGIKHGTVSVPYETGWAEVTTFRVDGLYKDGRRPETVMFVRSLEEDLSRRDFTINAMAMDRAGEITDLFGGRDDILGKTIRCVGEPEKRFREDALRKLRALRLASRLGFEIEGNTAAVLRKPEGLKELSAERVLTELTGILTGAHPGPVLRGFWDVLSVFIPEIAKCAGFQQRTKYHAFDVWEHTVRAVEAVEPEAALRLTMLFHDLGKPEHFTIDKNGTGHFYGHPKASERIAREALTRLKAPAKLREDVTLLVKHHDDRLPQDERGARRMLAKYGPENAMRLVKVRRADVSGQAQWLREEAFSKIDRAEKLLEDEIRAEACFSLKNLKVNGNDLMEAGLGEGRKIGYVLHMLLEHVLENPQDNERDTLLRLARKVGDRYREE